MIIDGPVIGHCCVYRSVFPPPLHSFRSLLPLLSTVYSGGLRQIRQDFLPTDMFPCYRALKRSPDLMCMIMNGFSYPEWQGERPAASGLGRGARVGCMSCHELYDKTYVYQDDGPVLAGGHDERPG